MSVQLDVHLRLGELLLDVQLQYVGNPIVALIGPNGAGKTSLLRTLAGAHRPQRGKIAVGDCVFFSGEDRSAHCLAPEKREVAYMPQSGGLLPHLSGLENVILGLRSRGQGASRHQLIQGAQEALIRVQAQEVSHKYPSQMSGGEVQRVALARLIATRPKLCLLDEPLAAIDLPSRRGFRRMLSAQLTASAVPTFFVTHDPRDVRELAAQVVVLSRGKVVASGSRAELCSDPPTDFAREFFATA